MPIGVAYANRDPPAAARLVSPTRGGPSSFPPSHFGNALGFLSLCASAEPYYVGSSTGFSLANLVQAAVNHRLEATGEVQSPVSDVSLDAVLNLPSTGDRPFSCHRPRPTTQPASLPVDAFGSSLVKAYLDKVHSLYPFLDEKRIANVHQARGELDATKRGDAVLLSKLHLVYGIGARHLQLLGSASFDQTLPEAHFTSAAALLDIALELRSIDNIEILLLLALYSLHSPSGPGAWQLTGMAIRLCVEFGLHRGGRTDTAQRTRCLFWSCLILERKVAVTLGRPFSLHDMDITAEVSGFSRMPDHQYPITFSLTLEPDEVPATLNHYLATLQTVTTRIHTFVNKPLEQNLNLPIVRGELDAWHRTCPANNDTLQLEYHKALLLLLQPSLTKPDRSFAALNECTTAAGAVCQLYKRIHQRQPAGFFLLELHDVLVAGITLIYSLWSDQTGNNHFTVLKDLGACSTVLFLIAERWQSAKRYRDAFEALTNVTTACLSSRSAAPAGQPCAGNGAFGPTPLDLGLDGQALFDPALWGNDDTFKDMLGEITGAVEPAFQDWSWFTDPNLLGFQG